MPSSKFDIAFKQLLIHVKDDDMSLDNMINITIKAIEIINIHKDVNGLDKKHIVLKMLRKLIDKYIQI